MATLNNLNQLCGKEHISMLKSGSPKRKKPAPDQRLLYTAEDFT